MRKYKKNTILGLLCTASVLCAGFGVGTIAAQNAGTEEPVVEAAAAAVETCSICGNEKHATAICSAATEDVTVGNGAAYTHNGVSIDMDEYSLSSDAFKIDEAASIRLATLHKSSAGTEINDSVDYSALRFRMLMKSETRQVMQSNFWKDQRAWEVGFLVIPANVLGANANGEKELTLETQTANKLEVAGYHWQPAQGVAGYEQVVYNLYNLPEYDEVYMAGICARGYVKYIDYAKLAAGATEEEATTIYYTNTYEISMTTLATKYVRTYEGEDLYPSLDEAAEAALVQEANAYRPDKVLSYRDGLNYEKVTAQYGDVVSVNTSRESGIEYSGKGVWTLPKNSATSHWKDPVTGKTRSYLEDGIVLDDLETSQKLIDHDFKVLYVNGNIALSSPIDLETSRATAQPLGEVPFQKTIRSITLTPKDNTVDFTKLKLSANMSISQQDGKSLVLDNMVSGEFYDVKTNSVKIPHSITTLDVPQADLDAGYLPLVDSYHDYGYAKFDITIAAGTDPSDIATYRTQGGLYSMKIYNAQDLTSWQEVAKTDYLDIFSPDEASEIDGSLSRTRNGAYRTKKNPYYRENIDYNPNYNNGAGSLSRWMVYGLNQGEYINDGYQVRVNGTDYEIETAIQTPGIFVKSDARSRGTVITNPKPAEYSKESYSQHRWGGYFVLGADIDMEGVEYVDAINATTLSEGAGNGLGLTVGVINGRQYGFTGTFDGNGYTIDNFTQSSKYGAFIGQLMSLGEIKNIAFTNAKQTEIGGFVVSTGCGIVHDVYVHFAPGGRATLDDLAQADITAGNKASWAKAGSSVFYSLDNMNEARVYNCLVNATDDSEMLGASNDANYDATLSRTHGHYGVLKDVFMIGGNYKSPVKINTTNQTTGAANYLADLYGSYNTYNDFLNDKKGSNWDFTPWTQSGIWKLSKEEVSDGNGGTATELKWVNTGFWRLTADGLPYPKNLGAPELGKITSNYENNARVSNYWGDAQDIYTETGSRFVKIVVDETRKGTGQGGSNDNLRGLGRGIHIPFGIGGDISYKLVNPYDPALTATTYNEIPANKVIFNKTLDIIAEAFENYEEETANGNGTNRLTYEFNQYGSIPTITEAYIFNAGETIDVPLSSLTIKTATPNGGGKVVMPDRSVAWTPLTKDGGLIDKTFVYSIEGYPTSGYTPPAQLGYVSDDVRAAFKYVNDDGMIQVLAAAPLRRVTHEINTSAELQDWLDLAKWYGSKNYRGDGNIPSPMWSGVFYLGNDIDMSGLRYNGSIISNENGDAVSNPSGTTQKVIQYSTLAEAFTYTPDGRTNVPLYQHLTAADQTAATNAGMYNNWSAANYIGFNGVFDGGGYTILNFSTSGVTAGGFIGVLNKNGVIRNLNFIGANFAGVSGFLTHSSAGTVENVYIQLDSVAVGTDINPAGMLFSGNRHWKTGASSYAPSGQESNSGMVGGTMSNVFINAMAAETKYGYFAVVENSSGRYATHNTSAIGVSMMPAATLSNVYMAGGYGPSNDSAWGKSQWLDGTSSAEKLAQSWTDMTQDSSGNYTWMNIDAINRNASGISIIGTKRTSASFAGTLTNVDYIGAPVANNPGGWIDANNVTVGGYYKGLDFNGFANERATALTGTATTGLYFNKAANGLVHDVYFPNEDANGRIKGVAFTFFNSSTAACYADNDYDYDITDIYVANLYAYRRWMGETGYVNNYPSSYWTLDRCGVPVPVGTAKRNMDWLLASHYLAHTNCSCTNGHKPLA